MMDFISFNDKTPDAVKQSPSNSLKQDNQRKNNGNSVTKNTNRQTFGSPAVSTQFGAPAIPFGSPAVPFGSPAAMSNTSFSPHHRMTSPRHPNQQYSPRGYNSYNSSPRNHYQNNSQYSPRQQNSHHFTPSPFHGRNNYMNNNDGSGFKTPHQFTPGSGRGRGNGRKSFSRQFGQTPRNDPNCNAGGSSNIEDYYHPSMVQDPWRNSNPVLAQT